MTLFILLICLQDQQDLSSMFHEMINYSIATREESGLSLKERHKLAQKQTEMVNQYQKQLLIMNKNKKIKKYVVMESIDSAYLLLAESFSNLNALGNAEQAHEIMTRLHKGTSIEVGRKIDYMINMRMDNQQKINYIKAYFNSSGFLNSRIGIVENELGLFKELTHAYEMSGDHVNAFLSTEQLLVFLSDKPEYISDDSKYYLEMYEAQESKFNGNLSKQSKAEIKRVIRRFTATQKSQDVRDEIRFNEEKLKLARERDRAFDIEILTRNFDAFYGPDQP